MQRPCDRREHEKQIEADLCSWSRKSKISGHKRKLKKAGRGQTTKIYGSRQGIRLYLNTETVAQEVHAVHCIASERHARGVCLSLDPNSVFYSLWFYVCLVLRQYSKHHYLTWNIKNNLIRLHEPRK